MTVVLVTQHTLNKLKGKAMGKLTSHSANEKFMVRMHSEDSVITLSSFCPLVL